MVRRGSHSSAAGDHRPDFNLVGIGEHFIFSDEFIAPDDEMRLNDQIEFAQQLFGAFRPFDFHLALWMTEVNKHAG